MTVVQGRQRRSLVVQKLGARRGPPPEARLLYDEPAPPTPILRSDPDWTPLFDEESLA